MTLPEWTVVPLGRKNAGEYGYRTSDWAVKERGTMPGEVLCIVPNGVTDAEDAKPGSLELANRITKLPALEELARRLSLCLDEFGGHQGTHYVRDGKIEPKGSFLALVEEARGLIGKEEADDE